MILSKWEIVNREMEVPSFYFKLAEVEALTLVSPFERQGFPPAGKSLPVLTTLSSRFSRGTMPALFRMAFSGIYQYPCQPIAFSSC